MCCRVACLCPKWGLKPCAMMPIHPTTGAACPRKWCVHDTLPVAKMLAWMPLSMDMAPESKWRVQAEAVSSTMVGAHTHLRSMDLDRMRCPKWWRREIKDRKWLPGIDHLSNASTLHMHMIHSLSSCAPCLSEESQVGKKSLMV